MRIDTGQEGERASAAAARARSAANCGRPLRRPAAAAVCAGPSSDRSLAATNYITAGADAADECDGEKRKK